MSQGFNILHHSKVACPYKPAMARINSSLALKPLYEPAHCRVQPRLLLLVNASAPNVPSCFRVFRMSVFSFY